MFFSQEATGTYRRDWLLRFVGLENYPAYREGGRLENYLGSPPLAAGAFKILQSLAWLASGNLEKICLEAKSSLAAPEGRARLLLDLAGLSLIDLARGENWAGLQSAGCPALKNPADPSDQQHCQA